MVGRMLVVEVVERNAEQQWLPALVIRTGPLAGGTRRLDGWLTA
jgi:hypothetical protein